MNTIPRILFFAGSAREDSYNKKLARLAANVGQTAGAAATFADLRDYPMPLFDQDLEAREGEPATVTAWKQLMKDHDAFVIASPEHNSTYSALLKNTIDWASRKREGEAPRACFAGKVALLISASPGNLGGLRGLLNLRALLANVGVMVMPDMLAVPAAHQAFDEAGGLKNQQQQESLSGLIASLVETAGRLKR
ncbi:MAG TPA: NAD(P)H-dependent oxidoreductase [Kiritimatiellia bacterium]|nr:NAD(P)H-dependent oxidoreductase [Kiritimatiellia bacterium]HMO98160.1 NAD(P)H-dependent oxidoreductase [Kiritimatiellia bacterium]HMP96672.1 NAD(P)H-dependent oxidoreductase [Kiritimatiellia bacterium]